MRDAKEIRERSEEKRREYGGKRRRYGSELRLDVTQYAMAARSAGQSLRSIASDLDMSISTLESWLRRERKENERVGFHAVSVSPLPTVASVSVVTPDGYRIEGLTEESVARLLASLR